MTLGVVSYLSPIVWPDTIFDANSPVGLVFLLFAYVGLIIFAMYLRLQDAGVGAKEISLVAVLSAFTAVARIPFSAVPGFQPCTYLVFTVGYAFGPTIGFVVAANTVLLSNMFLGHGPWTIYQIMGWGLVGVSGGLMAAAKGTFRDLFDGEKRLESLLPAKATLVLVGVVWAVLYTVILNIWFWALYAPVQTLESLVAVNLTSITVIVTHAAANVLFFGAFGHSTIRILVRHRLRFSIKYV
jgi:energy-coupling factor transport system substrate-specific component